MPETCPGCREKQLRIEQLEALIRRMAESADRLLKQGKEVEKKVKVATS